jgi:hypothetical protein
VPNDDEQLWFTWKITNLMQINSKSLMNAHFNHWLQGKKCYKTVIKIDARVLSVF